MKFLPKLIVAKSIDHFKHSKQPPNVKARQLLYFHEVTMVTKIRNHALSTLFYNHLSRVAVAVKSSPENVSCL